MKCPKCDKDVDDNWKCCPYCGSDVPKEKPVYTPCSGLQDDGKPCGYNLSNTFKFCPICGAKNDGGQTQNVSTARTTDSDYGSEPDCAGGDTLSPETVYVIAEEELKNRKTFNDDSAPLDIREEPKDDEADKLEIKRRLFEVGRFTKLFKEKMTKNTFTGNLLAKLNDCDTAVVRLGVIGRSGIGKSAFINLILGNKVAKTGSGDTTKTFTQYKHPANEHLTIDDMPGFGTVEMPKTKFLETVNLSQYDFFLIFLDTVFMEDDVWIANRLTDYKIPFCFVRSKMDIYLTSEEAKECDNNTTAVQKLRDKLKKSMKKFPSLKSADLFLITNETDHEFTFALYNLLRTIFQKLCPGKSDFLMIQLPAFSPRAIKMKVDCFLCRSLFFNIIRRLKELFFIGSSYENMKREIERCYKALQLDNERTKGVPGLQHILSRGRELPGKDDPCWRDISFLNKNYVLLGKDAIKVYNFYHSI